MMGYFVLVEKFKAEDNDLALPTLIYRNLAT